MTKRLETLFALVTPCKILADVGCDHGFIAKAALDKGVAEKIIISDISEKCLEKAKKLLEPYGDKVSSYVCDGLSAYEGVPDVAFIAGMGGDEITSIIGALEILPEKFVLSPQKNSYKVRKILIEKGYAITADFTFKDGKFYDAIAAEKGEAKFYNEKELYFGKDNLAYFPADFTEKINAGINLLQAVLCKDDLSLENRLEAERKLNDLKEILKLKGNIK